MDNSNSVPVDMTARVAQRGRILNRNVRQGDTVTITRMDARDGAVATDAPATWGHVGIEYELIEVPQS